MFKTFRYALVALAALAVVATACGDDDDDSAKTTGGDAAATFAQVPSPDKAAPAGSKVFVGHDKANKVSVGLTVFSDSKAVAYACDGDATWTWYSGSVSGNDVTLTSADGNKLTAKINGAAVTGTAPGATEFTLETAKDHAGLYRTSYTRDAVTETAGWVIENDGSARGGVGAVVAGKKLTIGTTVVRTDLAAVQALPEFADLKLLAPNFPTLPPDLTVFAHAGGLCGRIGTTLANNSTQTATGSPVNNTAANRARLGLIGLLGCPTAGPPPLFYL